MQLNVFRTDGDENEPADGRDSSVQSVECYTKGFLIGSAGKARHHNSKLEFTPSGS